MAATVAQHPQLERTWNFEDMEIRTKTVERTLAPLVTQVTTLVNTAEGRVGPFPPVRSKEGGLLISGGGRKARKADVLVAAVEKAIDNFIEKGGQILAENPDAHQQLGVALEDVRSTGSAMVIASRDFAQDSFSSTKRQAMVQAARALLSAVTRLLILADMLDVRLLLTHLQSVEYSLEDMKAVTSQEELNGRYDRLARGLDGLGEETGRRANDLLDTDHRDELQAARALLKTNAPMLYTATKAYVRHPEVDPARMNRDYVHARMADALQNVRDVVEGRTPQHALLTVGPHGNIGELIDDIERFQNRVYLDPQSYKNSKHRPELEDQLERIVSGAAFIADSESTREDRKERIVAECNNLRQALQDLLNEYERNAGRKEPEEGLDMALVHLGHKAKDLKRHLRRAVVDHVSDAFLDTRVPLMILIDAAKRGDQDGVEQAGQVFTDHANKLCGVAELVCRMSNNAEGVKMVRYASMQVQKLAPQVVNAARLLAARPQSKVAQENMDAFKEAWEERVRLLTLAVDSVITVDDFLAVSEMHIVEDVKACIQAVVQKDGDTLDRTAGAIRGRSLRVCDVVDADMELRPADAYSERVRQAVRVLRTDVLPSFASRAESGVKTLSDDPPGEVDLDEFIDASSLVHEAIRDIRHALLMNRDPGDIDSDEDYEEEQQSTSGTKGRPGTTNVAANQGVNEATPDDNQRAVMRQLPEQDKKKIQEQIDVFKVVQNKFEREVAKWDDAGNDIIVLAKYMCMIMMEMTDFTRGRGPLKTTMDVIGAAKKISEAGTKLNALAEQIADDCVQSETKKDLIAYLQRITLHCHQLNITSKVKADVQQVGDELVVSGLESAMSLIQTARNLLNAVVLTVKSAYIASTKYPRKGATASSLVVWKMRAPQKQPLYRPSPAVNGNGDDEGRTPGGKGRGIIRRASDRRAMPPIKALAEFNAA